MLIKGSMFGYHGISKGYYEDELTKIVDPKHRSMKQFFQEEVADVFGWIFFVNYVISVGTDYVY